MATCGEPNPIFQSGYVKFQKRKKMSESESISFTFVFLSKGCDESLYFSVTKWSMIQSCLLPVYSCHGNQSCPFNLCWVSKRSLTSLIRPQSRGGISDPFTEYRCCCSSVIVTVNTWVCGELAAKQIDFQSGHFLCSCANIKIICWHLDH